MLAISDLASQFLLAAVVDQLREFSPHEQADDLTLIVAKCRYMALVSSRGENATDTWINEGMAGEADIAQIP